VRLEDAALLLGRQAGKQRQDLGVRRVVLAQRLGRLADLALAGQEDQHVARPDAMQLVAGVGDRVVEIALVVGSGFLLLATSAAGDNAARPDTVRPETSITGAPSKCCEKRSASIVAEVMISFRSRRFGSSCLR
jgi:hypothetical protein